MKEVVIAGGTGLIGERLTKILAEKGYRVHILSRSAIPGKHAGVQYHKWDILKKEIPVDVILNADYIINMAGASVGARRWNDAYKKTIMDSRVLSTRLIVDILNRKGHHVSAFLNASAIGYYGMNKDSPASENATPGTDFMAEVCVNWEAEAAKLDQAKTRLVLLRTGIVFSSREGALVSMAQPVKLFAGAALGTGNQLVPWIHMDDECEAIIYAMENDAMHGAYNLSAPVPASNIEITRQIARYFHKPLLLPPVPAFVLRLILGEFAGSVLGSLPASPKKLIDAGFAFKHTDLAETVRDLYENGK